jgi:hypothetical protein
MMYFCPTTFSIRPGVESCSNMSQNNVAKMTFQCSLIHSTDYRITISKSYSHFQEYEQFEYFRHMYRLVHNHFPTFLLKCKGYGV